ncbi:DNA methylase N-4/N-6 domain-containing protein [Burkholderia pseudomallei]|uniref:site-specific DNA-methyltransferase n=1 Tax=Burkholderia pseudomallei TaxID=28450 RepID=UPI0009774DC7|nr:site-specific DNA-methyltransferase [Burkholderia pseudomallei]OMS46605.1 DNA methylase N-4 [Burkholderia pseudomallei]CAJ3063431.1 DNA methylase N-4/N-6 domain-containing protein [Burkholderia pseudomallei]CAJ3071481.1 DNA methylase N-4/N-6 domain-containing protein [Burkholderia pseudomallei]CAJ3706352.1 DNA methylase N-4/N-6 domain-containing protein [Burkholderia pseudomallei]CAJ3726580.1 DNA methylase N-4/N-6 domain-containing protein [Burkholderia pseudomallei]
MRDPVDGVTIALRAVDELIPYARNAKKHTDAQVAQIAASIREFGWGAPILVDGQNNVIAGHGRLLAARKLGLTEVPVVPMIHLTDIQRRALILADNKIGENASWDDEMLGLELAELKDSGVDLTLTGFSADEWDALIAGDKPDHGGLTDDDAVPEVDDAPVSRVGDLWLLGEHKLICGDATKAEAYKALLGEELADMAFTDPPYNVNYGNTAKDKLRGKNRPILNDNLGQGFEVFLTAACQNLLAVTKGAVYIAMSSSELDTLQSAFRAAGGRWSTFIIWAKNTFTLGRADYQRQYEPILYGWRDGADHFWCGARDQGDVWQIAKPSKNDLHPTMKPVELVERAVRNSSKTRDIVLDPFGGSGTTLIASEKAGRRARLIELDPKYVDVIVKRWQNWSGNQAIRVADGVAFDDVAAQVMR